MPDLLIELGVEELPSSACHEAIAQAPGIARAALADLRLEASGVDLWVSPRRIAVRLAGLPAERAGRTRSVRGPAEQAAFGPDGAPTAAAAGFARGQGVEMEALVLREDGARRFVFADVEEPAVETASLVPELADRLIGGLRFGKTMRWGDGRGLRFSRPLRWIVAKLGGETVPFTLHGLEAGEVSRGHRFLGGPVTVADPDAYRDQLREAGVVADHAERRAEIVAGLDGAAAAVDCSWSDPGGKLGEVLFLVERPSVITGRIAERHLALPPRVLVTAMQSHQRYFPLSGPDGALHAAFLAVSNGDPAHAEVITRGNEDVLDARLQDAAFSFEVDREAGLAALDARLDTIVFHQRLGTMAAKRDRLVEGVAELGRTAGLEDEEIATAVAAARLAKADQGAVLVAEFADLQGEVAAEYARREGHPEAVATAVAEHYLPLGPQSPTPSAPAGAALALTEKLDNLVGAFLVDEAPTGSKDPYALRRAAAGLVRILLERGWDVPTRELLAGASARLRAQGADLVVDDATGLSQLEAFVADRLAHHLRGEGVAAEAVEAAAGAGLGSVVATAAWARGADAALGSEAFSAARAGHIRLVKLAGDAAPGAATVSAGDADEDALAAAIGGAGEEIERAREARDFTGALSAATSLAAAVDRFLQDVMVNADDPKVRARRIELVRQAAEVLGRVADFTRVSGD